MKRQAYSAGRAKRSKTAGARYTYKKQRAQPPVYIQKTPKGVDFDISVSPIVSTTNTNDEIQCLNLIQQGAGSWNRVGRKVKLKSIRLKGTAQYVLGLDGSNHLNGGVLRMLLVWDKQPSGNALPAFDEIFGITEQDGTESSTVMSPPRYDNMGRFQVLMDKCLYINPTTYNAAAGGDMYYDLPFDEYVKLQGRETNFSGQSSPMTIADVSTGGLYLVLRANENSAGQKQWSLTTNSVARLRYMDME